ESSRMAQMRKAMSSGSAAASSSTAPGRTLGSTGKAARWGGARPRPKRGGPWCGAKRRSQSVERSAASSTPPGKTCAPGKKPWLAERCSSSTRNPSAGGWGLDAAAGTGRVQPAASTKVAARLQLLGPARTGTLMTGSGARLPGSGFWCHWSSPRKLANWRLPVRVWCPRREAPPRMPVFPARSLAGQRLSQPRARRASSSSPRQDTRLQLECLGSHNDCRGKSAMQT
uniref:Uncharacterized protein n=1 Tax=Bos mutus grunniens TaxID=30521 RepID=A0A8B9XMQ5_BOSMU